MNLKEARKATRGMYTRIEKTTTYAVTLYSILSKTTQVMRIEAKNIKLARKMLLDTPNVMVLDVEPLETHFVMYAMDRESFKANATKKIELED